MRFTQSVETCLRRKYATFHGRASRSEFWWFTLFATLVQVVLSFLVGPMADGGAGTLTVLGLLSFAVTLALVLPSLAVSVRRLHDTDRTGWWLLLWLVPLVGLVVLLVFFVLPGTPGANRFGPDPKGARPPGA